MGIHTPKQIEYWENELKQDFETLLAALAGRPLDADEVSMHEVTDAHRRVSASKVRVAADKLSASLKEAKRVLGKG